MPDLVVAPQTLDPETVRRLCGDLSDEVVSDILETGASLRDLEAALGRLQGEGAADQRFPLDGISAQVFDILDAGQDFAGEP